MNKTVKTGLLFSLILSNFSFASTYIMPIPKVHYKNNLIVNNTNLTEKEPVNGIEICSINFENMWTSGGQYRSPLIGQLKIKLSNGEYFQYQNVSSTLTEATFDGGNLVGSSYGTSYWKISRLFQINSNESYPYHLFQTGRNSAASTTSASLTFQEPKEIISLEYIDHHGSRWMDNYDLILKDCSNNIVFNESYTTRQSLLQMYLKY